MSILLFIIILLALVFVHELGHFLVAKWTGMRVDEFAFGFPPRLFSKKVAETEYSLNAIPLGGYVSIYGENGEPDDKAKNDPRSFGNRPKHAQLLVLVAGVAMNMLFAWMIFIFTSYGNVSVDASDSLYAKRVTDKKIVVMDAHKDSPAERAGLITGTTILNLQSSGVKIIPKTSEEVVNFVESHINESIRITFKKRNGEIDDPVITGVYGIVPDKKVIGISLETIGTINTDAKEAVVFGTERLFNMTSMTFDGLKTLVTSIGRGENIIKSLSGPIGIAKMVGQTENYGYIALLNFIAVLSINLAIFNSLPLPALDGGRFIIVILETVTRKRFSMKWLNIANGASFALLILLLVLVTIKDITH